MFSTRARVTAALFIPLALCGLFNSGKSLAVYFLTQSAAGATEELLTHRSLYRGSQLREKAQDVLAQWQRIVTLDPQAAEHHFDLGQARLAFNASAPELCGVLQNFRNAELLSPHSPLYKLAWADLAVQLVDRKIPCASASAAKNKTWLAELQAPLSITDLYWAGFVNIALGERTKGLEILRRDQELNPYFTAEQLEYLASFVNSGEELRAVMPGRYPQVVRWVQLFSKKRPYEFTKWAPVFEAAVGEAFTEVEDRYKRKALDDRQFSFFIKELSGLSVTRSSESLRKRADKLLAHIYRLQKSSAWADILEARANADRLPVLKGTIADDRHTETGVLAHWTSDHGRRGAALDRLGTSWGIYVPDGYTLDYIMLESNRPGPKFSSDLLRVLVSDDNLRYQPLYQGIEFSSLTVDQRPALKIVFDKRRYKFIKIAYLGPSQSPKFVNDLQSLLQAYGARTQ